MAHLVAGPSTEPKVRGLNHHVDKHFLYLCDLGMIIQNFD
jgi:hypothetical protein